MTEKNDDDTIDVDQTDSGIHETSSSTIPNSIQSAILNEMRSQHEEIMEELKTVKTQFGNQQKVLEELQSKQDQPNERESRKRPVEEPTPQKTDEIGPAEKKQKTVEPLVSKQFVLRHIFKNVSGLEEEKQFRNKEEEHFGVKWHIVLHRENENLGCYLRCQWPETGNKWLIESDFKIKVKNGDNTPGK